MSSPNTATATSNKRAHEDSSSANAPEAKRPALDPESKQDVSSSGTASKNASPTPEATTTTAAGNGTGATADSPSATKNASSNKTERKDDQDDVNVPDAPPTGSQQFAQVDETKWIHIRAIISSQEAATVIGKGGENVTQIRRMSEAKCTVSDYARGAVERILTVSGAVDAVAKVCI